MASTYSPSPKQLRILVRESAEQNGYRLLRTDIDFEAELTSPPDNDVQPSVNDLISSLRKSQLSSGPIFSPTTTATPTLPPQIRHLLAQPDTPAPRPRGRQIRRHDASGRRLPAGPAPPQSWLESSRRTLGLRGRGQQRVYPTDVEHLPGLPAGEGKGRRLVDMCLRNIARDWEFIHEYEKYNLVDLPSGLRMALLSVVAVHGSDESVGFEGLKNLLVLPEQESGETPAFDPGEHNDSFFRLDVSGAMGHSLSFKQLIELVQKPEAQTDIATELSWEESISQSLSPPLPALTHLSLSHPSTSISWPRLLAFAKHIPTLTHLSLSFWPVPSLTPNAKTAVMSSRFAKDIQYGGTNYYSHSPDNDFREAAEVLRRLAARLYGLEYLDLTGCADWVRALRWTGDGSEGDRGVDWGTQWVKLKTLKVHSGLMLSEGSPYADIVHLIQSHKEALATQEMLSWWMHPPSNRPKRKVWIDVEKDEWKAYSHLWTGDSEADRRKRSALDSLERIERQGVGGLVNGTEMGVGTGGTGLAASQWAGPVIWDAGALGMGTATDEDDAVRQIERMSVWEH
ncbi:uncharacterized protein PAC_12481 [Phialocephala subalpina]|uniref:Tafazzin n=1 Tax=Phialocephala subalpina TaxID=576137 RepID=A0A1L7XC22_9HELO|nr:uncharacterized protein PAC_12481 [Phialocephala subalpina]